MLLRDLVGDVFDDAATGQGLLNYFLRAMNCGAITEREAVDMSGLTVDELRTLARAYLAAKPEITVTRLGLRAANNDRLFHRLFAGAGCHTRSSEQAGRYFEQNWPEEVDWPLKSRPPRHLRNR